jgi:hypothetical protein
MLGELTCACENCGDRLGEEKWRLTMETEAGVRHVYECDCTCITVTIAGSA